MLHNARLLQFILAIARLRLTASGTRLAPRLPDAEYQKRFLIRSDFFVLLPETAHDPFHGPDSARPLLVPFGYDRSLKPEPDDGFPRVAP
ncbi:MAG: hypothetical protein KDD44_05035 [Bdellovibrionales bacterium]|nr:hypothetical protein [Bdellovibrionales bacterium]